MLGPMLSVVYTADLIPSIQSLGTQANLCVDDVHRFRQISANHKKSGLTLNLRWPQLDMKAPESKKQVRRVMGLFSLTFGLPVRLSG